MEWPVEQLWFKKWRRRLWNQVEGPKVLEIGVGTGKNISYYTEDLQVTAIDLSPGMLKRSKKKLARNNSDKTKKLADKLNILLANYSVFYQNTRGFHWNIKGDTFFELHVKFEELYDDLVIKID